MIMRNNITCKYLLLLLYCCKITIFINELVDVQLSNYIPYLQYAGFVGHYIGFAAPDALYISLMEPEALLVVRNYPHGTTTWPTLPSLSPIIGCFCFAYESLGYMHGM